jgi:hypothetical protein
LKSRRPTSDLRTSAGAKISKGLQNVKMISLLVSEKDPVEIMKLCPFECSFQLNEGSTVLS